MFAALADATRAGLEGVALPPEVYERAGQGWSAFFDRIAERLSGA